MCSQPWGSRPTACCCQHKGTRARRHSVFTTEAFSSSPTSPFFLSFLLSLCAVLPGLVTSLCYNPWGSCLTQQSWQKAHLFEFKASQVSKIKTRKQKTIQNKTKQKSQPGQECSALNGMFIFYALCQGSVIYAERAERTNESGVIDNIKEAVFYIQEGK